MSRCARGALKCAAPRRLTLTRTRAQSFRRSRHALKQRAAVFILGAAVLRGRRGSLRCAKLSAATPQTNSTLTQGVPATVTLSGPALFKGYFVAKPSPAVGTLSAPSVGLPYLTCGFGHTEPSLKPSVSFTFVPGLTAINISLTGFVVVTWSPSYYYIVNTTFTIAPAAPPPPPPPSPPPSPPLAPQTQPVTPAPTIVAPMLQPPPPPRPPPTTRAPLSDLGLASAAWSAASARAASFMAAIVVVLGA